MCSPNNIVKHQKAPMRQESGYKYNNRIFNDINDCKEWLVDIGALENMKTCSKCNYNSHLIVYNEKSKKRLIFRCKNSLCQFRMPIGLNLRLPLEEAIFILYLNLINLNYKQIRLIVGVTDVTVWRFKIILRDLMCKYMSRRKVLVGGPNVIVEVDESVICRRGVIKCPTSIDDNTRDTVWIVGGIENTGERNFFVKRVSDRKINTLTHLLENEMAVGSILTTDGYPSYPEVANRLSFRHSVVNHVDGFVSVDGTHTNNIEAFWSGLKSELRKAHGVKTCNIDGWLGEYTFRKRYLCDNLRIDSEYDLKFLFEGLIKLLFTYFF